jgi:DNA-binding CsgD family transcriptional regulator
MTPRQSQEARAYRSVVRACHAGLDSITLRQEVGRRTAALVPVDVYTFSTTDPDTALLTHSVSNGLPAKLAGAWVEHMYPQEEAESIIGQARRAEAVTTHASPLTEALLRSEGFHHEMRAVLTTRDGIWGFSCLLRGRGGREFGARETGFMRRIAPHVAHGLRSAALLDRATAPGNGGDPAEASDTPGVVVLDAAGRLKLRNGPAAAYLGDLADVGLLADVVPSAVMSVVARLRAAHAANGGSGDAPEAFGPELRVQGRSGRWYTLYASLSEPDATGESSIIVLVRPARRAELAAILTRLYGLSPRERETLARVARGESTKQIAQRFGISPYTVQEHVGRACEKVGVRTRKALLAKLFFDGYAPTVSV